MAMVRPERRDLGSGDRRLAAWWWPGAGTPLVMLPGAGCNGSIFADLVAGLEGRPALAIDPPGVGGSDGAGGEALVAVADELARLAAATFDGPVVWLGHSWGGKVAAVLAGRHPEVAAATVLIDPSPASALPLDDEALERFAASIWDGRTGPWGTEDEAMAAMRRRPQYRRWTPGLEASLRRELVPVAGGGFTTRCTHAQLLADSHATLRVDDSADVAALVCPTLYLVASASAWWQASTNDRVLPSHVERVEVEGQHLLHVDRPERVAAEIRRFLGRIGGLARGTGRSG